MTRFPMRVQEVSARVEPGGRKVQTVRLIAAPDQEPNSLLLSGGVVLELAGVMLSHEHLDGVLWLSLSTDQTDAPVTMPLTAFPPAADHPTANVEPEPNG